MTYKPAPDEPYSDFADTPADDLREHYKEQINYVLETSDAVGEVRVTRPDGSSEIMLASALLLDDVMHFVDAYIATHQANLLENLLGELPYKENVRDYDDSNIDFWKATGYNEAIDQATTLLNRKLKEIKGGLDG